MIDGCLVAEVTDTVTSRPACSEQLGLLTRFARHISPASSSPFFLFLLSSFFPFAVFNPAANVLSISHMDNSTFFPASTICDGPDELSVGTVRRQAIGDNTVAVCDVPDSVKG